MPTATRYLGKFQTSASTCTWGRNTSNAMPNGKTSDQAINPSEVMTKPPVPRSNESQNCRQQPR